MSCTTTHCACTRCGVLQGALRGLRYDPELLYIGAMSTTSGLVEGIAATTTA
jgi:hypothetical protein